MTANIQQGQQQGEGSRWLLSEKCRQGYDTKLSHYAQQLVDGSLIGQDLSRALVVTQALSKGIPPAQPFVELAVNEPLWPKARAVASLVDAFGMLEGAFATYRHGVREHEGLTDEGRYRAAAEDFRAAFELLRGEVRLFGQVDRDETALINQIVDAANRTEIG